MREAATKSSQAKTKAKGGGGQANMMAAKMDYPPHTSAAIAQEQHRRQEQLRSQPQQPGGALAHIAHAHAFAIAYPAISRHRNEALRALYAELYEVSQAIIHTSSYLKKVSLAGLLERQAALKQQIRSELERTSAVRGV